ncbi:MAG: MMPL family transporter, partial [Thermomicrobiales bacterium]
MSDNVTSSPILARFASIVTSKRARWVILALWIVVLAALTPVASRLSDVVNNDAVTFLPEGAESAQVATLLDTFDNGDTLLAVIVYQRSGGLTAEDMATIAFDQERLGEAFGGVEISPAIPSEDGQAVIVNMELVDDDETIVERVELLRETVTSDVDGLDVKVTGPAGFTVDFADIFEGIDTTLLLATATVVTILLL